MGDSFLPDGYEPPKASSDMFFNTKKDGSYRVRILDSPVMGYVGWTEKNKPVRHKTIAEFKPNEVLQDENNRIAHCWIVPVYDYSDNKIKCWEIPQVTIQRAITGLSKDAEWGSPVKYDIEVIRANNGGKVEYTVIPKPAKELSKTVLADWASAREGYHPERMFSGGYPFDAVAVADDPDSDIPFD